MKKIRILSLLFSMILLLGAVPLVGTAVEADAQGILAISEICASPEDEIFEFVEIVNDSDTELELGDYSICRYAFSDTYGRWDKSGLQQIMGWSGNYLADLAIVDLADHIGTTSMKLTPRESVVLWFVNKSFADTYTLDSFNQYWNLSGVKVVRIAFDSGISASTVNSKSGSSFLPDRHAGFAISTVKTASLPATVKDTNGGTVSLETLRHEDLGSVKIANSETAVLHGLEDSIALYFAQKEPDPASHEYFDFVDLARYGSATKEPLRTLTSSSGVVTTTVQTPYQTLLAGRCEGTDGQYPIKAYWDYDADAYWDLSLAKSGYTFLADGTPNTAPTPGALRSDQYSVPAKIDVLAVQNRINADGTQDLRFVAHTNAEEYASFGMLVRTETVRNGKKVSDANEIVTERVTELKPSVWGGGKKYTVSDLQKSNGALYTGTVTGVSAKTDTHMLLYVTPFGVLSDGGRVYGETVTALLNGTKPSASGAYDYRIMSFNVLRANQRKENGAVIDYRKIDYASCLKSITDYDPDVVGFQEYCAAFTYYLTPMLETAGYTVIGNSKDVNHTDHSGKTLYTDQNMTPLAYKTDKFNCLDYGASCVYGTYDPNKEFSTHAKTYPGHWITWAVLEDIETGEIFGVATTHGFHNSDKNKQNPGQLQYHVPAMIDVFYKILNNEIARAFKGETFQCPVIFVGDYNMTPTSAPYKALFTEFVNDERYDDSYGVLADGRFAALVGYDTGGTYHTLGANSQSASDDSAIDHLLTTQGVGVVEHQICITETTTAASDHYPVFVDIILSEQPYGYTE